MNKTKKITKSSQQYWKKRNAYEAAEIRRASSPSKLKTSIVIGNDVRKHEAEQILRNFKRQGVHHIFRCAKVELSVKELTYRDSKIIATVLSDYRTIQFLNDGTLLASGIFRDTEFGLTLTKVSVAEKDFDFLEQIVRTTNSNKTITHKGKNTYGKN